MMIVDFMNHKASKIQNSLFFDLSRFIYSTTFQSVGKNFRNFTFIIGDSNTKHSKFSTGEHCEKETFHIS